LRAAWDWGLARASVTIHRAEFSLKGVVEQLLATTFTYRIPHWQSICHLISDD